MNPLQKKKLTFEQLVRFVSSFYNIRIQDIIGIGRKKNFVEARQVIVYLARENLKKSFPAIGKNLGNRDHTTAIYSYHKVKERINKDDDFKKEVESILLGNFIFEENEDDVIVTKTSRQRIKIKPLNFIIKSPEDIPLIELSPEHSVRQNNILKKYKEGQTLEEIGNEHGLTRERIRQIVERGLIQSIGEIIKEGITVDSREFLKEEKRKHLEAMINKRGIFQEKFPSYKQVKRWSKYYDRCRKCGTNIINHHSHGYCRKCYSKTEIFKEIQESSRLRNIDRWKNHAKEYSREYFRRPEVIKKRQTKWDLKYFGGNREKVLVRDGEKCQICSLSREESYKEHDKDLIVVHINDLQDNSLGNLLTLCKNCFYDHIRDKKTSERN